MSGCSHEPSHLILPIQLTSSKWFTLSLSSLTTGLELEPERVGLFPLPPISYSCSSALFNSDLRFASFESLVLNAVTLAGVDALTSGPPGDNDFSCRLRRNRDSSIVERESLLLLGLEEASLFCKLLLTPPSRCANCAERTKRAKRNEWVSLVVDVGAGAISRDRSLAHLQAPQRLLVMAGNARNAHDHGGARVPAEGVP